MCWRAQNLEPDYAGLNLGSLLLSTLHKLISLHLSSLVMCNENVSVLSSVKPLKRCLAIVSAIVFAIIFMYNSIRILFTKGRKTLWPVIKNQQVLNFDA